MMLRQSRAVRRVLPVIVSFVVLILPGVLIMACSGKKQGGVPEGSNKFKQYYIAGAELYTKHCSNCHRADGSGLGLLYPPLDTSDYMDDHFTNVLYLMRYGHAGELVVNGRRFNKIMPGNAALTDLEVAEIATYIYNTWGHARGIVDVKDAAAVLDSARGPVQGSR